MNEKPEMNITFKPPAATEANAHSVANQIKQALKAKTTNTTKLLPLTASSPVQSLAAPDGRCA